jgi:hypothetical protein
MTIKFFRGNTTGTKIVPMPVPPLAQATAPAGSITAQKKAAIAKNKETVDNIAFFFKAFRGMGQK